MGNSYALIGKVNECTKFEGGGGVLYFEWCRLIFLNKYTHHWDTDLYLGEYDEYHSVLPGPKEALEEDVIRKWSLSDIQSKNTSHFDPKEVPVTYRLRYKSRSVFQPILGYVILEIRYGAVYLIKQYDVPRLIIRLSSYFLFRSGCCLSPIGCPFRLFYLIHLPILFVSLYKWHSKLNKS